MGTLPMRLLSEPRPGMPQLPLSCNPPRRTPTVDVRRLSGYNRDMAGKQGQSARKKQPKPRDAVQEAIAYGIDVAALRDNLALTPAERLRRHEIALHTLEMLQKARRL